MFIKIVYFDSNISIAANGMCRKCFNQPDSIQFTMLLKYADMGPFDNTVNL